MSQAQPASVAAPLAPDFDPRQFRSALAQFATGVTVVTTKLPDGRFIGLTANSFNSVSLEPPFGVVESGNRAQSLPVFQGNSHYVINVLSADQQALAEQFQAAAKIDLKAWNLNYHVLVCRSSKAQLLGLNAITAANTLKVIM